MLHNAIGCVCVSVYVYGSAQINVRKVYDPALLTLRGGERYVHFPEKKRYTTLERPPNA